MLILLLLFFFVIIIMLIIVVVNPRIIVGQARAEPVSQWRGEARIMCHSHGRNSG